MSYLVIDCTSCGSTRVVQADKETAQCHRCNSRTRIEKARVHARTETIEAAQNAVGQVNAQRAGAELEEDAKREVPDRDAIDRALGQARGTTSERTQVQLAAEGLTEELSSFTEDQWVEALSRIDVERARALEHLERLQRASIVAEPSHGEFEHVG